jgi:hypothetical protein
MTYNSVNHTGIKQRVYLNAFRVIVNKVIDVFEEEEKE